MYEFLMIMFKFFFYSSRELLQLSIFTDSITEKYSDDWVPGEFFTGGFLLQVFSDERKFFPRNILRRIILRRIILRPGIR
jgi:hypothetical protein